MAEILVLQVNESYILVFSINQTLLGFSLELFHVCLVGVLVTVYLALLTVSLRGSTYDSIHYIYTHYVYAQKITTINTKYKLKTINYKYKVY